MRKLLAWLILVAGVLAAHWWLLTDLPWNTAPHAKAPPAPEAFDTRTITPPPPPPPPVAPPRPPAPKPRPAPPPPPKPAPAAPAPEAPAPADASDAPAAAAPEASPAESTGAVTAPASETAADATAPTEPAATPDPAPEGAPAAPSAEPPPQGISVRSAKGQPPQTDLAFQPPPAMQLGFQVQGQVKGFHYSASARLLWQPQLQTYQARQEISAFLLGARSQSSQGHLTAGGLQPDRFEDLARKKLRVASLDWVTGLARFEPEAPLVHIAPGTQDRLSVFLQLAGMLAAAPQRYPAGAEITLPTASTKAVEPWTFQVHGAETLNLPAGAMEALRLERLPRNPDDQKAELWLAPSLGYLPVRIRLSESQGDYADLQLQSHSAP